MSKPSDSGGVIADSGGVIDIKSKDRPVSSVPDVVRQDPLKIAIETGSLVIEDQERKMLIDRYTQTFNSGDTRVSKAIEALEKGRQVINIAESLSTGWNPNKLPFLALAPAGVQYVYGYVCNGELKLSAKKWWQKYAYPMTNSGILSGRTRLPFIPPDVRPSQKIKELNKYFVMWQVETWRDVVVTQPVSKKQDPCLIEPISGQLGLVVATWDLTELELAALTD